MMMDCRMMNLEGELRTIPGTEVEELAAELRGALLAPDHPEYEEARHIWNAMIDRRPGLIVQCMGAADVVRTVRFARDRGLLVTVRGGGHNIAGNAVADDALMIDLSPMKSVRVDPTSKTARVEPGALLGDVDRETQTFGLAVPTGINSTTGIAGLTLGGGFGWLSRKFGMTIDNLRSADVVTASGELVKASESENADLFWGVRGGGGNLGIVTSFEFGLHRVGPMVYAGLVVHDLADAKSALEFYREFTGKAPDELTVWAVMRKAPPLPFLPEDRHGTDILAFALLYAGDPDEGEKVAAPIVGWGNPIGTHIGPAPYAAFQTAFDPLLTPGARNYWKSHNFAGLEDGFLSTIIESVGDLPSPQCEIFIGQLGGAQGRVPVDATAYPHRDAKYLMNVHTRWEDAADDERCRAWARGFFEATLPYATGGVYVNFMPDDEGERVPSAFGPNMDRMIELKQKYDPDNFFRRNMNVSPAG